MGEVGKTWEGLQKQFLYICWRSYSHWKYSTVWHFVDEGRFVVYMNALNFEKKS